MARHSYFSDLEAVKQWFDLNKIPKWNLYRGHLDKMYGNKMIYRQEDDTLDMDESWSLLRSMIENNSANGGQFTIYVPSSNAGNQGLSVHVELNMDQHRQPGRGVAVSGYGGGYGLGMIPKEEVREMVAQERKVWELERRLEDMEASQEAGLGIGDIIKSQLQGVDLGPIIAGIGNLIMAKAVGAGVTLQGVPGEDKYQPPTEGQYHYDGARLKPILDTIRPHFGEDEEFYNFLQNVAIMIANNPVLLKNMVSNE